MSDSCHHHWTVAHQASLSMGFLRQEYWRELPFLSPEDLHDPGIKPGSPALQIDSLPTEPPWKPQTTISPSNFTTGHILFVVIFMNRFMKHFVTFFKIPKLLISMLNFTVNFDYFLCHPVVSNSCGPIEGSLPGSSVHGICQARILECFAISFSRGSSRPRDQTRVSSIAGRFFTF